MAQIISDATPVTAQQIWDIAQLPLGALSVLTPEDAINLINTNILPSAQDYVLGKVQAVTVPYGYPLDESILTIAFNQLDINHITVIVKGWDISIQGCIKYFALADLFLMADISEKNILEESKEYRKQAEYMLGELLSSIQAVMKNSPDNAANKGIGILIIKNRKNKGPRSRGFSW